MIFHFNTTVIFVTRGKIKSAVFSSGGKIVKEVKSYNWKEETLQKVLDEISSRGPSRARVVFGEEFSYVVALPASKGGRMDVLGKAREVIPEELENNWDFRKGKDKNFSSQVVAIQPRVLDIFNKGLAEAGFKVKAIESQSLAVARLLPTAGLFLFAVKDEKLLIGAVSDGIVIATNVSDDKNDFSALSLFVSSVQKKTGTRPEMIYVGKDSKNEKEIFDGNGLKVEVLDLDPLRGIAIKKHLIGEDAHVLNIKSKKVEINVEKKTQSNSGFTLREKILTCLFIALVIAGGVMIKTKYKKSTALSIINIPKKQITVQNTVAVSQPEKTQQAPVEVAKQEVVVVKNAQELQISILNGGAVPGSAGKIKDLLTSKGYLNIEATNANASDNKGIVIYYQNPNVDGANKIKSDLQAKYPKISILEATSDEQKSSEIVIILGK